MVSKLIDTDAQIQGEERICVVFKIKIEFQQLLDMLEPVGQGVPVNIQGPGSLLDVKGIVKILLKRLKKVSIVVGVVLDERRNNITAQLPEVL